MGKPLRKCKICGLEAWTEKDLEKFEHSKTCKYNRGNRCQKCNAIRYRKWIEDHPLLMRFHHMKTRCYKEDHPTYQYYGARGITICDEWFNDRETFVKWAKENGFKKGLSLDRIDNDGPYSPENCRWVDRKTQMRNTRRSTTNWDKGTRICSTCREEKPLSEFYKNQWRCKDCTKKILSKYAGKF